MWFARADVQREGAARGHQEAGGGRRGLDPQKPAAARRRTRLARRAAQFLLALRAAHNDRRRRMRSPLVLICSIALLLQASFLASIENS